MSGQPSGSGTGLPAPLPSTPPAEEWQASWARTLPALQKLSSRPRPTADVAIQRSSQLDAARLDEELTGMLREQFLRAFALFRPAAVARLQPELTLLLDLLIFRFSVLEGRPLPGMALMNLQHRNEAAVAAAGRLPRGGAAAAAGGGPAAASAAAPSSSAFAGGGRSGVEGPGLSAAQRWLYCGGAVLLRYAWARLGAHAASAHWGDASRGGWRMRGWDVLRRVESGYRLASLLNLLAFLRWGRYRSLLERLLRARLVYAQPSAARAISFEYLNRQLVWSELSELLLFLLPLLNVQALKHALRSYLPRLPVLSAGMAGSSGGGASGGDGDAQPCGICNAREVLQPYAAVPCGHAFCYYCLRSHCLADPTYSCPLCLRRVDAMQPCLPAAAREGGGPAADGGTAAADSSTT